jgi:hypothetical protein
MLFGLPADAQQPQLPAQQAAKPANIDRNGVLMLVRSSLLALDQANKTGNYTVLRDIGAPGFQINTAARLAEIFVKLRNDKVDLSGVAVIDPQLSVLPQIEANGMMRMAGFFPSVPSQVNFDLIYAPVEGQWRLFGISVSINSSPPVTPNPRRPQISRPRSDRLICFSVRMLAQGLVNNHRADPHLAGRVVGRDVSSWQCAPKARITSGGRFHPESCRLIW